MQSSSTEGIHLTDIQVYIYSLQFQYHDVCSILVIYSEVEIVVPYMLIEELADLRIDYVRFLLKYERVVQSSHKAQVDFISIMQSRLFPIAVSSEHSFQSCFDILIDSGEVSLFNITYMKRLCSIFPHDIW